MTTYSTSAIRLPLLAFLAAVLCQSLAAIPLRVLAWDDEVAARKLSIVHAKGANPLENLHPFTRSAPINVVIGEETPPRLQALDRLDEKGVPAVTPIQVPAGMKYPLLLLLPDAKSATGIRTMVLEDDPTNFRWGTIRLINSTGKELIFKWEKKLAKLPTSWAPTEVSPGGDTRNMGIGLFLPEKPNPPLYSAVWEHREDARKLVFVVPGTDPTRGPVDFKFIIETQADAAAAAR